MERGVAGDLGAPALEDLGHGGERISTRCPTGQSSEPGRVAHDDGRIIRTEQRRVGDDLDVDARIGDQSLHQPLDLDSRPGAQVHDAIRFLMHSEREIGLRHIADVEEVAYDIEPSCSQLPPTRLLGRRDLARPLRQRRIKSLPGTDVVEGSCPDNAEPVSQRDRQHGALEYTFRRTVGRDRLGDIVLTQRLRATETVLRCRARCDENCFWCVLDERHDQRRGHGEIVA